MSLLIYNFKYWNNKLYNFDRKNKKKKNNKTHINNFSFLAIQYITIYI